MKFTNKAFVVCHFCILVFSVYVRAEQPADILELDRDSRKTPILAQAMDSMGREQLGKYASYSSKKQPPYLGIRAFAGFNFAPHIRSRISSPYSGYGGGYGGNPDYTFLHTNPGSFLAGASFFYTFTQKIGFMATFNWELVRTMDRYRQEYAGGGFGGGMGQIVCTTGTPINNECYLQPSFRYHLLSLELSGYFHIMPEFYFFLGPHFSIPIEVRSNNYGYGMGGGSYHYSYQQPRLGGFIGFQAGVGFVFQYFFIEALFKAQFLTLQGFTQDMGQQYQQQQRNNIGRLLGGTVRGGVQFLL